MRVCWSIDEISFCAQRTRTITGCTGIWVT
jgi:hypothetical protein